MHLLRPFIALLLLGAQPTPVIRWVRVPADMRAIAWPPLLRLASGSFVVEFDANIENRKLVNINNLKGHPVLVPSWSEHYLPLIILGPNAKVTTGHFRFYLNTGDTHLDQKASPKPGA